MKRFFVVSDIHSFYTYLKEALDKNAFSIDNNNHILVLLGDVFDRGPRTRELAEFLLQLYDRGRLVYIKGNHESLAERLLQQLSSGYDPIDIATSYHATNGTWRTVLDLAEMTEQEAIRFPLELVSRVKNTRVYKELLPSCIDYFETPTHIFVHGWIPTLSEGRRPSYNFKYNPHWRDADETEWEKARWVHGPKLCCNYGIKEPGKSIVCGHINASWGHSMVSHICTEFGDDAIFTPFYADGLIALDTCTVRSKTVNCIVIDEQS